jgi:hypothetical protein
MTDLPTEEELNEFRTGEAISQANRELLNDDPYEQKTEREDFETDLDLKATLIDPQAKVLFPLLNKSDLMLSSINPKDKKALAWIDHYRDLAVDLYENGYIKPAKLLADRILTKFNSSRSTGGFQQQMLITRVKAQNLQMNKDRNGNAVQNFIRNARG